MLSFSVSTRVSRLVFYAQSTSPREEFWSVHLLATELDSPEV